MLSDEPHVDPVPPCEASPGVLPATVDWTGSRAHQPGTSLDAIQADDRIGGYLVLRELGRGSFSRVFLAKQTDLGDRLVVLKVSTSPSAEPQLMGKASHAHVIEILENVTLPGAPGGDGQEGGLLVLSMPFLGGATLDAVLRAVRRRKTGRDLLEALDRCSAQEHPGPGLARSARELLGPLTFAQAAAWIGARLAEALDHAHRRGVSHGDLKPSNILLTADGHPMLLDFNLAVDWIVEGQASEARGTIRYMAPERLQVLGRPGLDADPRPEDHRLRADLFSLGLVLVELLTGSIPEDAEHRSSELTKTLSGGHTIPAGLRAILRRCLESDPSARYGSGTDLARDLDAWREDRPPAHVREPRHSRLLRPLRRRRRTVVAVLILAVVAPALALAVQRSVQAVRRDQAQAKWDSILDGVEPGVFRSRQSGRWDDPQEDAGAAAVRSLSRYGVLDGDDWRARSDVTALPIPDREELELWLTEQAWRLARATLDGRRPPAELRRALTALSRVAGPWAPAGPLLRELRAALGRSLGLTDEPPPSVASPGPTWRERYLAALAAEPRRDALALYEAVLAERPDCFWADYRAAAVAARLGEYATAAKHLGRCVARRPRNAALRAQLGGCLCLAGRLGPALPECNQAEALAPELAETYWNRALIRARLGSDKADIEHDIEQFARLTRSRGRLPTLLLRFDVMLSDATRRYSPRERTDLMVEILDRDPERHEVRMQLAYERFNGGRVDEALAQLEKVRAMQPGYLPARLSQAEFLRTISRVEEACRIAEEILADDHFPEFLSRNPGAIRAYHMAALGRAHSGAWEAALALAQTGVARSARIEPKELRGESYYALAVVLADTSQSDPSRETEAVSSLREALRLNPACRARFEKERRVGDPARIKRLISDAVGSDS
jgi:serine/threonine protein kinase/tetratricopeptide (TPR) repeat protein